MSLLSHGLQRFSGFAGSARLYQQKQQGALDGSAARAGLEGRWQKDGGSKDR